MISDLSKSRKMHLKATHKGKVGCSSLGGGKESHLSPSSPIQFEFCNEFFI